MAEPNLLNNLQRSDAAVPAGSLVTRFLAGVRKELRENWVLFLMALPALAVVFVISYMPMPGIILAFKDYKVSKGIWGSDWVGLKNFQFLISSGTAWQLIRNTVVLNTLFIIAAQVGSLLMASLLNEVYHLYIAKIYQSILFFPHFISWVLVGFFTFAFLNSDTGYVNTIFKTLGLAPVNWYAAPEYRSEERRVGKECREE